MVKTGLKIYKDNIWHFFTILGFVALGVIIGVSILIPAMRNVVNDSANKLQSLPVSFDPTKFFNSLFEQFKAMDWSDPINTLKNAFTQSNLVGILQVAAAVAGLSEAQIIEFNGTITTCATNIVNTSVNELIILISSIAICSIIGYVLIRTRIHFKTTENRNLFKYIITTVINVLFIGLIFYLMALSINNVKGTWGYITIIAILLFMAIGILTLSFLGYAKKGTKFKDIVNLKTVLGSLISDLIIVLLSYAIVAIIYPFNEIASILIAIPLFIITSIIMDATTNAFVNNFAKKV